MRKFLILIGLLLVSVPLFGQWRRAALFGADVRALIVDPKEPDTLYLGTSGGEVYLSTDAAKTWTNPYHGTPFPGYIVDNLLVDRDGRLWTASWGLWGGGVIAVSNDRGRTWTRRDAGLEDFSVRAIAVDPHDPSFVVVGGLTGVYRSDDGGTTWNKISDQENVESLAVDPRTHDRIYVGTWRQGQRSEDGGKTWKMINNGMVLDTDMFQILVEHDNPDSVWVSTCGWVYNSGDRGDKWTRYRDGFNNRRIHDIEVDPCNRDTVYAGSVGGLYRTDDRGKSWYAVSSEDLVINSIALDAQRPHRVIVGVEGDGVYVSDDDAKTFTRSSKGLYDVKITTIVPDPSAKDRVYASVVFGGAASGMYRSNDGGATWERSVEATKLPEVLSLDIARDGEADPKFIAGTERGFFFSNDGVEWTQSAPVNLPLRVDKVVRFNHSRLFAATNEGVYTSRDGGKSWYVLGGADTRTVDLAIGMLGDKRGLFALTENGITAFDGSRWLRIIDSPSRGRTIALRHVGTEQLVFIAGVQGVKAGRVDENFRWIPADAPDALYAAVYSGSRLFLTSREREILVADPAGNDWRTLAPPTRHTEVTAIALDPFVADRYFVGTQGEGVWVYEGKTGRYVPQTAAAVAVSGGGTQ
jgi:photosystem II stability/assembly factor-like uncharacterized protein